VFTSFVTISKFFRDCSTVQPASVAGVSRLKRIGRVCHVWHITQAAMPAMVPPRSVMNTRSTVFLYASISAALGPAGVWAASVVTTPKAIEATRSTLPAIALLLRLPAG
jgi:hypothetical protein